MKHSVYTYSLLVAFLLIRLSTYAQIDEIFTFPPFSDSSERSPIISSTIPWNDKVVFHKFGQTDAGIYITNGSEEGTQLLKRDMNISSTSWIDYKDALYFSAFVDGLGVELWKTDGTVEGIQMVSDFHPGYYSSNPAELTLFKDKLFFCS